ncbi:GlgB N-terminal domain-containing protein [Pseudoduganella buxea]
MSPNRRLTRSSHEEPAQVLGMHAVGDAVGVRAFSPSDRRR